MSWLVRAGGILWRIVAARRRQFVGIACTLVAALLLPTGATPATRWILAWDIGVAVFLVLTLILFLTEDHRRMAANARAQEEGEWTIFAITVGA